MIAPRPLLTSASPFHNIWEQLLQSQPSYQKCYGLLLNLVRHPVRVLIKMRKMHEHQRPNIILNQLKNSKVFFLETNTFSFIIHKLQWKQALANDTTMVCSSNKLLAHIAPLVKWDSIQPRKIVFKRNSLAWVIKSNNLNELIRCWPVFQYLTSRI